MRNRQSVQSVVLLAGLLITTPAFSEPKELCSILVGHIGIKPIIMNLGVRDYRHILKAHYYYDDGTYKDIHLAISSDIPNIVLKDAKGGTFDLSLDSGYMKGKRPSTLYDAIGLKGSLSKGAQSLPVKLKVSEMLSCPGGASRYSDVNVGDEAFFEQQTSGMVADIESHRLNTTGNANLVSEFISYPMAVYTKARKIIIRNRSDLRKNWSLIFNNRFLRKIRNISTKSMAVENGKAVAGKGVILFDAGGISIIDERK